MKSNYLINKIQIILGENPRQEELQKITSLLHTDVKKYTWVGFYFMNHQTRMLHLGPFSGKPTDHKIIPFGKGICGQVALSGETYVAEDVAREENYIACSLDVKSEIVVPIYVEDKLIGQLDIDSDEVNAFSREDQLLLKTICEMIGAKWPRDWKVPA